MKIENLFKEYSKKITLDRAEEIIAILKDEEPTGDVLLLLAYSHDTLGFEAKAEKYYKDADKLGFRETERRNWYLFLGSTLRWNKKYEESLAILNEGYKRYNEAAFKSFIAMTEFKMGIRTKESMMSIVEKTPQWIKMTSII